VFVVTVLYPHQAGSKFDQAYYMQNHIPLVRRRWSEFGLTDVSVLRPLGTPDGSAPLYQMIALLTFGSQDEFQKAAAAHGTEVLGDVPNFTSVQPVLQFNERLG
jgi:uncharacterized protein (TIGR02118 family)